MPRLRAPRRSSSRLRRRRRSSRRSIADAELFVFPSIYEGFGFPLLEAMAYGVPSIAARSSSLPEIGGDAALYFDPRDSRALEVADRARADRRRAARAARRRGRRARGEVSLGCRGGADAGGVATALRDV